MTWYYASGGQQMGPVEEAALDELVRQGAVRDDTLVWRQGLPGWQPHATARPHPASPPPSAPVQATPVHAAPAPSAPQAAAQQEMRFCSNCGRPTPVGQMSNVNGAQVCAVCLPALAGAAQPAAHHSASGEAGFSSQAAPQGQYGQPAASYAPAASATPYQQAPYQQPTYQQAPYPQASYPQGLPAGQARFGGFWIRFLARFIDGIILFVATSIIRIPLAMVLGGGIGLGLATSRDPAAALAALPALTGLIGLSVLINIAVSLIYEVYFVSSRGATPGKIALGLKIVRADGGPISMGLAAGRYFASLLSGFTFLIGYIIAGFDEQKRALHDRICNTRVIKL